MINYFIIVIAILFVSACSVKKEDEASTQIAQACTSYVDNGTNAYFKCTDYTGAGITDETIKSACTPLVSGQVSASCPISGQLLGANNSTGKCATVSGGNNVVVRWYYSTIGNGLSETALCTASSGTWTAD